MDNLSQVSNLNIADQCIMAGHISQKFFQACVLSLMESVPDGQRDAHSYLAYYGC